MAGASLGVTRIRPGRLLSDRPVDLTALDGRAFERFLAAGTYFLKKYRGALNDLNVFPVPDGDTGSNMYLTARAALAEVVRKRADRIGPVAAAAAAGSLLGARGNSGVILSQMLRGFARSIGDRPAIGSEEVAAALQEAVRTARAALQRPVEGTMITVGTAAAEAASAGAPTDRDLVKLLATVVDAAAYALARTPEQLPILREAGVVDSGGAGLLYFLEGILRFRPGAAAHETAYPQNATRDRLFTASYAVSENKYCTEFVLENARVDDADLRELLAPLGESLIVAGAAPTLKVHIHTADAAVVRERVAPLGDVTRLKVDDMSRQHDLLLVDAPTKPFSVFAVVPGDGFAQIARELGADQTLVAPANPSVGELVVGANSCLTTRVYLLPNEGDVILAANQAAALSTREVVVVPTRDVPARTVGSARAVDGRGRTAYGRCPDAGRRARRGPRVGVLRGQRLDARRRDGDAGRGDRRDRRQAGHRCDALRRRVDGGARTRRGRGRRARALLRRTADRCRRRLARRDSLGRIPGGAGGMLLRGTTGERIRDVH